MKIGEKGACTVVVRIINMLPDKFVMAGIIVLILYDWQQYPCPLYVTWPLFEILFEFSAYELMATSCLQQHRVSCHCNIDFLEGASDAPFPPLIYKISSPSLVGLKKSTQTKKRFLSPSYLFASSNQANFLGCAKLYFSITLLRNLTCWSLYN